MYKDLTGQKFGRYTVIGERTRSKTPGGWNISSWLCKCDCGTVKRVQTSNLMQGNSCGCARTERLRKQKRKTDGFSATTMVLSYYQKNAERRGLSWELDRPTFEKLIAGACFYCGAVNSMTAVKHYDVIQHNGVDRSDPSKGYVDGNVVSCCKTCNNAKASMTVQDFLYWARRVVGHSLSI